MQPNHKVYFLILRHLHLEVLDALELLRFFLDEEVLAVADDPLHNVNHFVCVGGREEAVLGRDVDLCERFFKLVKAFVVRSLLIKLICFVVDYHFEVTQIKLRLSFNKLILEVARYCHQNVTLLLLAALSENRLDFCLASEYFDDLLNLSDQLSSVRQDNHLHFEDTSVDFHETWHDKRTRLSTTVLGLEGIVERGVVHDIGDRVRLDNGRLEVVELGQACLNVLRYAQRIPSFFP